MSVLTTCSRPFATSASMAAWSGTPKKDYVKPSPPSTPPPKSSGPRGTEKRAVRAEAMRKGALPTDLFTGNGQQGQVYYKNVATQPLSNEIATKLMRPVKVEDLEIDPDRGYVYLKEATYREMLDDAFGQDGWKLVPVTPFQETSSGNVVYRAYTLIVNDRFVSEAIGDWSVATAGSRTAAEAKCDHAALVRVGKDLGMASELWDPVRSNQLRDVKFTQEWIVDPKLGSKRRVWTEKKVWKAPVL
ncbi:hypothetical protein SpCBS45565_g02438 [Spizellomyces sp. 'palustris']|nr:hypothetical protein SpCBS45565_g02438 [Spizellomyces sp. 'palustris']